jgi:hypothetical protein
VILRIHHHRRLRRIPIVQIVRGELVIPLQRPRLRIQRHHRIRIQVIALPLRPVEVRTPIPRRPEQQVRHRIVCPRQPRRRAPVLERPPFPCLLESGSTTLPGRLSQPKSSETGLPGAALIVVAGYRTQCAGSIPPPRLLPSSCQSAGPAHGGTARSLALRLNHCATSGGFRRSRPGRNHAAGGSIPLDRPLAAGSPAHPTVTSTSFALGGILISVGERYNRIASSIPRLASSSVSPAEAHPGNSGQTAE